MNDKVIRGHIPITQSGNYGFIWDGSAQSLTPLPPAANLTPEKENDVAAELRWRLTAEPAIDNRMPMTGREQDGARLKNY
jgi:hypothetical protein